MLLAYCDGSSASVSVLGSHRTAHGSCFSIRVSAWAARSVFRHTGVMIAVYCQTTSLRAGWLLWLNTCLAWDWCVVSTSDAFFFRLFFSLQNTELQYFSSLEGELFSFYHCSCISLLADSREGWVYCGERILLEPFFYVGTEEEGFVEVEKLSVKGLIPPVRYNYHLKGGGCSVVKQSWS